MSSSSVIDAVSTAEPTRVQRADITALRAIAVLLVVAFHGRFPFFGNGFIGVDIFFVVSGYLITGLLAGEYSSRGTIRLARFYTRRVRRLLPASALTVLGVLVLSLIALPREQVIEVAQSGLATAGYVVNFFHAITTDDLAASDLDTIPLIHFWSLAVEEQFYLVWPLVILGLSRIGNPRGGRPSRAVLLAGVCAITAASFVHSVMLVNSGSTWGYYSPLSRAWEFGAGAILAIVAPIGWRRGSDAMRQLLLLGGAALIAGSLLIVDPAQFPGLGAVPVVLGTLLVLHAVVDARTPLGFVAGLAPVQWLGHVSYSWYLWHWPILVIGQAWLDDTSAVVRIALIGVSLAVAAASYHLIESPIRHADRLVASLKANVMLGLALSALMALASLVVWGLA